MKHVTMSIYFHTFVPEPFWKWGCHKDMRNNENATWLTADFGQNI